MYARLNFIQYVKHDEYLINSFNMIKIFKNYYQRRTGANNVTWIGT